MNYSAPNVYIQDVVSGSQTISQASSTVGVMIGVTRSGKVNEMQKVRSWNDFVDKYALGLNSPFDGNDFLPYSVFGFFQNGGKELYVCSLKKNAVKATGALTTSKLVFTAVTEGVWGNSIKVTTKKAPSWTSGNKLFNLSVEVGGSVVGNLNEVTYAEIVDAVNGHDVLNKFVTVKANGGTDLAEENITLTTGTDGDSLTDTEYINALRKIDELEDVSLVAIPGQTSNTLNEQLMFYCNERGLFPFLDMPISATVETTKTYRKSIEAFTGALAFPWGKINDAVSGKLKAVPTCGHLMGVYVRIIENRGVHKAPAGTEAVVRGFVEMNTRLTENDIATLNSVGVIPVVTKPNLGIVVWGARSLNSKDKTMRYVTDGLLNLNIKRSVYEGTMFAVFEPIDDNLFLRVNTAIKAFLETLRLKGALKGSEKEAYYVIVDETNNTPESIENGILNIEVGYAPVKPAEFVVIKLAHSIVKA